MASPLPTPLAAALGIVPAVFDKARRLPGRAVRLPLYAVSSALQTVDTVRREYDDLADRGERLAARFRGGAAGDATDSLTTTVTPPAEDTVDDRPAPAPFSTAHLDGPDVPARDAAASVTGTVGAVVDSAADAVSDAVGTVGTMAESAAGAVSDGVGTVGAMAGSAAGAVADAVDTAAGTVEGTLDSAAGSLGDAVDDAAGAARDLTEGTAGAISEAGDAARDAADALATATQAVGQAADRAPAAAPDAEAPKGVPTPTAPPPDATRVDTAASPSVVQAVEQAVQETGSGTVPDHDALPLPDYDHMTLGSLRGRLRALTLEQLVDVRAYEKAHADRLPVVTMLDNRIAKLSTDPSATPSGPVSLSPAPEQLASASGPSGGISPATTDAPPMNPPSQGDPTNPSQPRR